MRDSSKFRSSLVFASIVATSASLWVHVVAAAEPAGTSPQRAADGIRLALMLTDGQRISGTVERWDFFGLTIRPTGHDDDAPAKSIEWCAVNGDDTLATLQRLIRRTEAGDWLQAGLTLLDCDHEPLANRAFAHAIKLDKQVHAIVDTARAYKEQGRDVREVLAAYRRIAPKPDPNADRPAGPSGPARPDDANAIRGTKPWPELSPEEAAAAVEWLRDDCIKKLAKAGIRAREFSSKHFLLFTNIPPADAQRCLDDLEAMNALLVQTFELPKGFNVFHGKGAVFILDSREDYLTFERAAFSFDARRTGGVCHQRGPNTYCSFYRADRSDSNFRGVLVHETVHAFVYRYKSPTALPTWANEGLADLIAAEVIHDSDEGQRHWNHARQFAIHKKRAMDIMLQNYADGSWYTVDSYPISHMMVRLMIKGKPRAFKQWIDDIKSGIDWRTSMQDRMGATLESLSERFNATILSEKRYTRIRE